MPRASVGVNRSPGSWLRVLAIPILISAACGGADPVAQDPPPLGTPAVYQVPLQTGDGWPTASLGEMGMDSVRILDLLEALRQNSGHGIHGIVVARDGHLVLERYFRGEKFLSPGVTETVDFHRDSTHFLASVTKSATAMAVGQAVGSYGMDLESPVFQVFPEVADLGGDGRESITLRHLISMRAGLEWDEDSFPFGDPRNHLTILTASSDPVRFVMGLPLVDAPGTTFHYNSGATNVLGAALRVVAGQRLDVFLNRGVFQPLGIQQWSFEIVGADMAFASSGLHLRPRDMVKLGQVMADGGFWQGEEILPGWWVDQSTTAWSSLDWGWTDGYGMGWWTKDYDLPGYGTVHTFAALGWGEQAIFVAPELGLVMALTAGMYDGVPWKTASQIWAEHVLPAVK